tara:strand:+ start:1357 stop:2628 length:1272 start_codon:yes stop_codon:yes gene_type:complete
MKHFPPTIDDRVTGEFNQPTTQTMSTEIRVPSLGESVSEAEVAEWLKSEGDPVAKDEAVVVIDSEKASIDIPAPVAGVLGKILKQAGEAAAVGEALGIIEAGDAAKGKTKKAKKKAAKKSAAKAASAGGQSRVMPAAQRLLTEHSLSADEVKATGPGGRLLKEDVQAHIERGKKAPPPAAAPAEPSAEASPRADEVVRMTPLRRTIARRLVEAQQSMAMLTTVNEVDMSTVMQLRRDVQEKFKGKHGVKLGFMSFFVKAVVEALKNIPQLNAEIRGNDIVFHRYYDIGVAIGAGRGLVVPPLRNAEQMGFADVEKTIADLAARAKESKLLPEELEGGTFTISNGGVYGSLLSTPIINPPQTGILGMHTIQERPVARDGEVVIRPMMNIALSYDHRIVDGREAVMFLRHIKELVENPAKILFEL